MNLHLVLITFACVLWHSSGGDPTTVTVQQGQIVGETVDFNEDGISTQVDIFKGIPFAEPPLRFAAPKPKEPWVGDWNATYFRPACYQIPTNSWKPWVFLDVDEDCLYLNVYTPSPKPDNAPVMVYIHGGSYTTGTAMDVDLSGVPMAAFEGVITVVINYRLNVFGYLSTGDDAAPGNFGFLDQAEALKWVRANIQAFGGDDTRITIFGESAGSGSVDFHRFSKYSRDFFDQSILQSGSAIAWWSFVSDLEEERAQAFSLGEKVNCEAEDTVQLIDCLRSVDAARLYLAYSLNGYNWWPNLDGVFLDESPFDLLARGDVKDGPMMVGYNRDEGTLIVPSFYPDYVGKQEPPYIPRQSFDSMVEMTLYLRRDIVNEIIEDSVKQEYMDWSQADNDTADYFLQYLPIYGDITFSCPANEIIRAHASVMTSPVYQYFLTHVPTTSYYERDGEGLVVSGRSRGGHSFCVWLGIQRDIKDSMNGRMKRGTSLVIS
ncbi:putative cholinesterase 1 [Apostichopus japonicus]|uniref:Carboxylic ester hydrolase n=1 Tax=Stichopus japonicus TaxID=307972 RepID=A0A2G8KIS6_STIJA|nr:putative cholinesterase 1 [Apostichopus japonicus]